MRSHPLSDQLPGEHTGQVTQPSIPLWVSKKSTWQMMAIGRICAFQIGSLHWLGNEDMAAICQQWGSNSPPFAQESDVLLTELSWTLSRCWWLNGYSIRLKILVEPHGETVTRNEYICFFMRQLGGHLHKVPTVPSRLCPLMHWIKIQNTHSHPYSVHSEEIR